MELYLHPPDMHSHHDVSAQGHVYLCIFFYVQNRMCYVFDTVLLLLESAI